MNFLKRIGSSFQMQPKMLSGGKIFFFMGNCWIIYIWHRIITESIVIPKGVTGLWWCKNASSHADFRFCYKIHSLYIPAVDKNVFFNYFMIKNCNLLHVLFCSLNLMSYKIIIKSIRCIRFVNIYSWHMLYQCYAVTSAGLLFFYINSHSFTRTRCSYILEWNIRHI